MASCCLAVAGRAADPPAWLVVGPWEARFEASMVGNAAALRVVVPRLRITLDLDQQPPTAGSGAVAASSAAGATAMAAPSVEFPSIAKSIRIEDGELVVKRGDLTQTVAWHGELSQAGPGLWQGAFVATGTGVEFSATVTYEEDKRTWRIPALTLRVDLASWSALILPKDKTWSGSGAAVLEAALAWTPEGLDGTAALTLRDGRVSSADGKISADGIEATVRLMSLARLISAPAQQIKVGSLTAGTLKLSNIIAGMEMVSGGRVVVQVAAEGFGGRLRVEPFTFDLASPDVRLTMDVDGIDAQGVLALFPEAPQGHGTLVGRVPLSYENGDVRFGEGHLGLKPGTTGRVQFRNPGLFTQAWPRWLLGWGLLNRIEGGQEALLVNELSIALHPPGTPSWRAAQIRIMGVPADHPNKGPFTFEFNVNAPLEQFMNLGMKGNMQFDFK